MLGEALGIINTSKKIMPTTPSASMAYTPKHNTQFRPLMKQKKQ